MDPFVQGNHLTKYITTLNTSAFNPRAAYVSIMANTSAATYDMVLFYLNHYYGARGFLTMDLWPEASTIQGLDLGSERCLH